MKKILILIISSFVLLTLFSTVVSSTDIESSNHIIEINTEDTKIEVKETIILTGETGQQINLWIQSGAKDIEIKSSTVEITKGTQTGNVYPYTITSPDITKDTAITITISYNLPKKTDSFEKKLLVNNSNKISVSFDGGEIYTATNLKNDSKFVLTLYDIAETPLTWYIIIFVVLLIILLVITAIYSFKKQKPGKKIDKSSGSEEFLTTKKILLMSILKDIEKQHRSKKISDDTYHKLKDQYKQEAVDAMKKLEDINSKVK